MKSNPYLIFDFDGTLVDSFHIVMKKFNLLADEFNFRKINDDEINTLRHLTSQAFYIGDETRDIEAAKASNINSIAVTWDFNSEIVLLEHEPHFIARKPEDILAIFKKIK